MLDNNNDWIEVCPNIKIISIEGYDNIYGFDKISRCKKLEAVHITKCRNIDTKALSECQSIEVLHMENNNKELADYYDADYFAFLKDLPLMKKVDLEGYVIDKEKADIIQDCKALVEISIANADKGGNLECDIAFLDRLTDIRKLFLYGLDIVNIESLYSNRNIEDICISYCNGLGELERFADMRQLKSLDISFKPCLTEEKAQYYKRVISEKSDCELHIR